MIMRGMKKDRSWCSVVPSIAIFTQKYYSENGNKRTAHWRKDELYLHNKVSG